MSAPILSPAQARSRLERLVSPGRVAIVVTCVFWGAVVITAVQLLLALTGSGALLIPVPAAQAGARVCLSTAPALLSHVGTGLSQLGLAPGVRATWDTAFVCTAHPTTGQALAFAVTLLPLDLLRIGALYLLMRLARAAARDGAYTTQAARLVAALGWWLLAGGLAATAAQALARVNLLAQLVTGPVSWGQWPAAWSVSWPVFWFGLGLIIFARVMRAGAVMRADLEGTV